MIGAASSEPGALPCSIEQATPSDAAGVYDVVRTTWLSTYPNEALGISVESIRARVEGEHGEDVPGRIERWRQAIEDPDRHIVVAKQGDRVLGYVAPVYDEGEQHVRLGGLYVLPEAQGKGLGHQLIEAAIASIGREHDIYLHVATYNARTIDFYTRHGFVRTGRDLTSGTQGLQDGSDIPELEMVLPAGVAVLGDEVGR